MPILARPHLVLPNTRNQNGSFWCMITNLLEAKLWLQCCTRCTWLVRQWELFLPSAATATPWSNVGLHFATIKQLAQRLQNFDADKLAIANNRNVGATYFALFCWVNIDMNDFCLLCKCRNFASYTVVKTSA